jgi:hypothetical protein
MEQLPPAGDDSLGAQPCGPEGVCTREVYEERWARGQEIFKYLERVPEKYAEDLGMGKLYHQLIRRWSEEIQPPSAVADMVDSETLGNLLIWTRQSETLIYYVTYEDQGQATPGPTTPGLLKVVSQPEAQPYHWPWIEGWDDPAKRALILNPKGSSKITFKKVLLYGGVAVGAIFAGKKLLADA